MGRAENARAVVPGSPGHGAVAPRSGSGDPQVARILRSLLGLPRSIRIYPAGHQRIEAQITELQRLVRSYLGGREGRLALSLNGIRLEVNGTPFSGQAEISASLAFKLRRRRIRRLDLLPEVSVPELYALARMLATDHKDLIREGGADAFLDRIAHPNLLLGLIPAGGGDGESYAEDEIALPPHVAVALENILAEPETIERLARLRAQLGNDPEGGAGGGQQMLDQLVWDFFSRPEWARLDPREVERAFSAFLELVEHAATRGGDGEIPLEARAQSLKSFFRGLAPDDLLGSGGGEGGAGSGSGAGGTGQGREGDAPTPGGAFAATDLDQFLAEARTGIASATEAVRNGIECHDASENALMILCQLLVSSRDMAQYRERRSVFIQAFVDRRYRSASVARLLRFLAAELPSLEFESRDSLVHDVFENTADEEALVLFLVSMTDRPDVARPILDLFVARADPFPLLVRLLGAPLLDPFRHVLTEKLLEAARAKPAALRLWARENRRAFFRLEVFEPLFHRSPESIGAICKEILAEGPAQDRNHLIERLRHDGTETALRILLMGMSYGDGGHDLDLLRALSAFPHPLAVAALREAVHRCNIGCARTTVAAAAMEALSALGTDESRAFLREIIRNRKLLLRIFRKPLRLLAARVLARRRDA